MSRMLIVPSFLLVFVFILVVESAQTQYLRNISISHSIYKHLEQDDSFLNQSHYHELSTRKLLDSSCRAEKFESELNFYKKYLNGMKKIYERTGKENTCFTTHEQCGWNKPSSLDTKPSSSKLPLFILSVGLEGAGHHLWTEILNEPIHDCVWTNSRHYDRQTGDGVPKTSHLRLKEGINEQFRLRIPHGPPCTRIYDSEDSFPTGAIRSHGRVFMRPDILNLEMLDGDIIRTKYLIILRNITVSKCNLILKL